MQEAQRRQDEENNFRAQSRMQLDTKKEEMKQARLPGANHKLPKSEKLKQEPLDNGASRSNGASSSFGAGSSFGMSSDHMTSSVGRNRVKQELVMVDSDDEEDLLASEQAQRNTRLQFYQDADDHELGQVSSGHGLSTEDVLLLLGSTMLHGMKS